MAHNCNIPMLYGSIQAKTAIDDGPIFNKSNILNSSLQAQIGFAKTISKEHVEIGKVEKAGVSRAVGIGRTWDAVVPKKVSAKVDKKMRQWTTQYQRTYGKQAQAVNAKYNRLMDKAKTKAQREKLDAARDKEIAIIQKKAKADYRQSLSGQFKAAREQLQTVYDNHADSPKQLEAKLKAMGIARKDAYFTNEYLKFLENGGPFFDLNPGSGSSVWDVPQAGISNVQRNKVRYNSKTAIFNVFEIMQKAPSTFGLKATMQGIGNAAGAAKKQGVTIFDRIPSLEKAGVYDHDLTPVRAQGKNDPVTRSQNMLDNLAYYIGEAGGDTKRGLKEIAYRPEPWKDTVVYADPRAKDNLAWMSFQFRHIQQYGGWIKDALHKDSSMGTRLSAAKSLATYSAITGLIYGTRAAIPAPVYYIWKAADPDLDEKLEKYSIHKGGAFGAATQAVGKAVGLKTDTTVDLSKYTQPLGGIQIGLAQDATNTAKDTVLNTGPKAIKAIREGKPDKAAAMATKAIAGFSQIWGKGLPADAQKILSGIADAYINDEDFEGYFENALQKQFGKEAVSK